jgi:hypothetical protein
VNMSNGSPVYGGNSVDSGRFTRKWWGALVGANEINSKFVDRNKVKTGTALIHSNAECLENGRHYDHGSCLEDYVRVCEPRQQGTTPMGF